MTEGWDERADVVVVGFGAAGACAAIEAHDSGADVLVIDRFFGGGATRLSGGIVYAGGGTAEQRAAGINDTPEAMYDYLRHETSDAVSPETLKEFCVNSVDMLEWLKEQGVPFDASPAPYKTSYPTDRYYLYYSGSEMSARHVAPPAMRGHRTHAKGQAGKTFYARLADAVRRRGVRVLPRTTAVSLLTDADGRVTGVEGRTLRHAPGWARWLHRVCHKYSVKPGMYYPPLGRRLQKPVEWLERRYGRQVRIHATRGVVLSAGGFIFNRSMLREHAPRYRGGLPLGTPGDNGSGILLGQRAGGATSRLGNVTLWRFLTPPSALLHGILVDRKGSRVCDEALYGAAIGDAVLHKADGRAWLLVDHPTLREARRQVGTQTLWFQRLQAWYLFLFDRVSASTLELAAAKAGIDPAGLVATVRQHNAAAAAGDPDPTGKPEELVRPQATGPFSLLDCSVRPRIGAPAPMLTLGGLVVDEQTGAVRREDGTTILGLYAAGRNAVGICSTSYVSGLSLADCTFSGRRAGRHVARGEV
jgi:3-oxo-5alpha-steroid 4-dehydrogenase